VSASPVKSGAVITTHPLAGVFGVLLGAMIATCTGRLISVGLADLRGALHLGVDEASWIGTAFNAAMMFIGPFSVYLGGLLGARRVLLVCASLFTLISLLLPFAPSFPIMLVLLVLAGLTAGTFYPLTLSFVLCNLPMCYVLLGIAMYALDILVATNFATSLEGWYLDHLSWHWIFWNGAALTPIMMVLIYFGIPWQPLPQPKEGQPKPNWRGFLYASLGVALLYIALDQGQRLDWLHSGTIVGLIASGVWQRSSPSRVIWHQFRDTAQLKPARSCSGSRSRNACLGSSRCIWSSTSIRGSSSLPALHSLEWHV
jgi:DHA2 family multidrug resistance protein